MFSLISYYKVNILVIASLGQEIEPSWPPRVLHVLLPDKLSGPQTSILTSTVASIASLLLYCFIIQCAPLSTIP